MACSTSSGDSEEWRECCNWLTRIGLLATDHRANWPKATIRDLAYTLRDGVQLCRLLNLIQPNSLDLKDINQRPQMAQFLCLRNIRTFLQVCKSNFDLKDTDLFQPSMLFDLSDFGKVLSTLSILSNCPKAKRNGVPGFSISGVEDGSSGTNIVEDLNLEDFSSEPTTPVVLIPQGRIVEHEESIYEELCYITFRIHQQTPVTLREKRDYVKGELLETETNYIDALQMLKKKFMRPLSSFIREEDRKIVFFGIKELNEIHTGFLSDLTRVLTASPSAPTPTYAYGFSLSKTLGDVFTHWKEKFIIYGEYCANLTKAQSLTEELCAKNELLNLEIQKCEKEANGGRFKLRDLLSVPMQRVLKYHLLLKKLLDETLIETHGYDEYHSIEKAHEVMADIAEFTNEVKRDSETLSIIRQIEGSIYDLKMPDGMELKDYGRLQKDGELRIRGHDDNRLKSRYVFVFDKVMIMCKATRMMDKLIRVEQYSYKHSLCLQEYRVEDIVNTGFRKSGREPRWSFGWNLVHHKEKNVYTMFASTEEQKKRWIKAIEDALNNIQPIESRSTEHVMIMHSFERGSTCQQCKNFMKGLFYQGYRCVKCESLVHRECIGALRKCGSTIIKPPELPPRPLLLPIPSMIHEHSGSVSAGTTPTSPSFFGSDPNPSPSASIRSQHSRNFVAQSPSSPPLPLNNLNSPCTANGMRNPSIAYPGHHYVNLNHLENYPWFAGEMEREMAESILERQSNGTFLVRVRPLQSTGRGSLQSVISLPGNDGIAYALSLKWNDGVKHMKILLSPDEKRYFLSESRYFKSIVELIHWYQQNSLAESFSGLDACLQYPFDKLNSTNENHGSRERLGSYPNNPNPASTSPRRDRDSTSESIHAPFPFVKVPVTPPS